jgi:hypothetical protein
VTISNCSAQELARNLRTGEPSVLPTVQNDAVFLDVRTITDDEVDLITARIAEIASGA